jgi:3-mercaptopyruvate sulfurtransferase SseA
LDPVAVLQRAEPAFRPNFKPDGTFKSRIDLRAGLRQHWTVATLQQWCTTAASGVSAVPSIIAMKLPVSGRTALYAGSLLVGLLLAKAAGRQ